jgi:hypothetical protein
MAIETLLETQQNRRAFLTQAGLVGAGVIGGVMMAGCGGSSSSSNAQSASNDSAIISAAIVAETLAVTTYTGIINSSIFTSSLASNTPDQAYLTAAQSEEQIHLNALVGASGQTISTTTFYFPTGMFTNAQTTLNTLVTFEDAFIAAYLIGVQQFSTTSLKLLAARIMGNESEHRVLARVIANDLGLSQTTGLSGTAEPVQPSNDRAYEATFNLTSINQAVAALKPYFDPTAAAAAGNTVTATYAAITPNASLNDINS